MPGTRRASRAYHHQLLRYDLRVVVTLCADEIGVPARDDGDHEPPAARVAARLPLALARRTAEEARMARAVADLEERGEALTSRVLAAAAHISRVHAYTWLRQRETSALEAAPA